MKNHKVIPSHHGITSEGVHWWYSPNIGHPNGYALDIPNHGYTTGENLDSIVNRLWIMGFKDSAREINTKAKEAITQAA